MAIMTTPGNNGQTSPTPGSAPRRQRAPTITIDTSAVSPPLLEDDALPLQSLSDRPQSLQGDQDKEVDSKPAALSSEQSPTQLRAAHSFDNLEHRPTSAHNVSSPTSRRSDRQPHDFLAVPNARSRGNSVDSEEPGHTPTSFGGDTYVPSPSSSALSTEGGQLNTITSTDSLIDDGHALDAVPGTEAEFGVEDNKFAFSPGQLSKLMRPNPKSFAAFHALGGLRGLEKGLRTDQMGGLSVDEKRLDGTVTFEEAVAAGAQRRAAITSETRLHRSLTSATAATQRSDDSFLDRKRIFKDNQLPEKKAKSFLQLAWLAYNDKVLILLTVAAIVSLALGIYESISSTNGEHAQWVEGVAITVAILIVVVVGAANDWQKERQFVKLNKKKVDRDIKVIRSGKSRQISVHDILVGDVVHLEPGDMIPVDGIFISGHDVKCDESSVTGESDLLKKHSGEDVYQALEARKSVTKMDPFIISGAKVTEGIGTFLVTAVGVNSSYGKIMMSLREDSQTTPLQSKLNVLAEYIAKLGLGAGLVLFIATFIRFLTQLHSVPGGASAKGQHFLQVFIVAVTIVVVAVPEGLPLAVTLALAFATTRMLKENNLVRLLRACETMGNATVICSDKTGTLTQNKMSVVAGTLGASTRFGNKKSPDNSEENSPIKRQSVVSETFVQDASTSGVVQILHEDVKLLLKQSIAVNSTAFEGEQNGRDAFIGSKTETALLNFARDYLAMDSVNEERSNANVVQMVPFDSGRKCMATIVKLSDKGYRMYVKGASEILLEKCTRILQDPTKAILDTPITQENVDSLNQTIDDYASRSLRTIGLLYRDFKEWPMKGVPTQEDSPTLGVFETVFKEMVFLGIVGIQDPLRDGVADAVRACQNAGVKVRMVTGDNLLTAKAIAAECGIYTGNDDEQVIEGPEFRKLSESEKKRRIPKLEVLARSSPDDKRVLVRTLKELGETVAVTGDGTNDAPALKIADVGFSMGIAGTEVAKEASAIILMDDNFASIVKAIMWGRAVNDSVKKFLQVCKFPLVFVDALLTFSKFQVTVNITAVVLTFVSAVSSSTETSVLTAVQLLWVNLIMDTFAALALATDPPTPSILNRPPEPKSAPLITLTMWKMIIGQSIFQLFFTLLLFFGGVRILSYDSPREQNQLQTLIFNTFVWMQIFNQYNNRRLDNKMNILEGVLRNYFFIGIQVIIIGGQILIIYVGGQAFSIHRLNRAQWIYSIILGFLSIPVAACIRLIPDELIRKLIPKWLKRKTTKPEFVVSDEERQAQYNPFEEIRQELTFMKRVRGGRLHGFVYNLQHPREALSRSRSGSRSQLHSRAQTPNGEHNGGDFTGGLAPPTPESRKRVARSRSNSAFGPAAAMAGIVAGSIVGWSPIGRRDEDSHSGISLGRSDVEDRDSLEIRSSTRADENSIRNRSGSNISSYKDENTSVSKGSLTLPERGHQ